MAKMRQKKYSEHKTIENMLKTEISKRLKPFLIIYLYLVPLAYDTSCRKTVYEDD